MEEEEKQPKYIVYFGEKGINDFNQFWKERFDIEINIEKKRRMRNFIRFVSRDWIDTIMLVLMVVCVVGYFVKGDGDFDRDFASGNFTGMISIFFLWSLRLKLWYYMTWTKIDNYLTDDYVRSEVFGLPRYDSLDTWRKKNVGTIEKIVEVIFLIVTIIIVGAVVYSFIFG